MDHSAHTRLREDELTENVLAGATVYGPDDDTLGTVEHLEIADGHAFVVVSASGQLVTGNGTVTISILDVTFMRDQNGSVHGVTSWSRDELVQRNRTS